MAQMLPTPHHHPLSLPLCWSAWNPVRQLWQLVKSTLQKRQSNHGQPNKQLIISIHEQGKQREEGGQGEWYQGLFGCTYDPIPFQTSTSTLCSLVSTAGATIEQGDYVLNKSGDELWKWAWEGKNEKQLDSICWLTKQTIVPIRFSSPLTVMAIKLLVCDWND